MLVNPLPTTDLCWGRIDLASETSHAVLYEILALPEELYGILALSVASLLDIH